MVRADFMVQMQANYNLGGYITDLIIPVRMLRYTWQLYGSMESIIGIFYYMESVNK